MWLLLAFPVAAHPLAYVPHPPYRPPADVILEELAQLEGDLGRLERRYPRLVQAWERTPPGDAPSDRVLHLSVSVLRPALRVGTATDRVANHACTASVGSGSPVKVPVEAVLDEARRLAIEPFGLFEDIRQRRPHGDKRVARVGGLDVSSRALAIAKGATPRTGGPAAGLEPITR